MLKLTHSESLKNILIETLSQVSLRLRYVEKVTFQIGMINIERNEENMILKDQEGLAKLPEFKLYL
jgi:thioredoxin-related protein